MQNFSFIPLMASEKIFLMFFFFFFVVENLAFRLPWPPIKISDLDIIHLVGRELLKIHFSKTFVKISAVTEINANFQFSYCKYMETFKLS